MNGLTGNTLAVTTVNCAAENTQLQFRRSVNDPWMPANCQLGSGGRTMCDYEPGAQYRLVNSDGQQVSGTYLVPRDTTMVPSILHFRRNGTVGFESCAALTITFTVVNCTSSAASLYVIDPQNATSQITTSPSQIPAGGSAPLVGAGFSFSGNSSDTYLFYLGGTSQDDLVSTPIAVDGTGNAVPSPLGLITMSSPPTQPIANQSVYFWDTNVTPTAISNTVRPTQNPATGGDNTAGALNTAFSTVGCAEDTSITLNSCFTVEMTVMVALYPNLQINTFVPLLDSSSGPADPVTIDPATIGSTGQVSSPGQVTITGFVGGTQLMLQGTDANGNPVTSGVYSMPGQGLPPSITFPVTADPGPSISCQARVNPTVFNCFTECMDLQASTTEDSDSPTVLGIIPPSMGINNYPSQPVGTFFSLCGSPGTTSSVQVENSSSEIYFQQNGNVSNISCLDTIDITFFNCTSSSYDISYSFSKIQPVSVGTLIPTTDLLNPASLGPTAIPIGATITATSGSTTLTTTNLAGSLYIQSGATGQSSGGSISQSTCFTQVTSTINNCYGSDLDVFVNGVKQPGVQIQAATSSAPGTIPLTVNAGQTVSLGHGMPFSTCPNPPCSSITIDGPSGGTVYFTQDNAASDSPSATCLNPPTSIMLTVNSCYDMTLDISIDGSPSGQMVAANGQETISVNLGQIIQLTGNATSGTYNVLDSTVTDIYFPSDGSAGTTDSSVCTSSGPTVQTVSLTVNNCYSSELVLAVNGTETSISVPAANSRQTRQPIGSSLTLVSSTITSGAFTVAADSDEVYFRTDGTTDTSNCGGRSNNTVIIIILVIVALLVIGFILFLIFRGSGGNRKKEEEERELRG